MSKAVSCALPRNIRRQYQRAGGVVGQNHQRVNIMTCNYARIPPKFSQHSVPLRSCGGCRYLAPRTPAPRLPEGRLPRVPERLDRS
eukprot:6177310-Pleurochrysis_carterae.AAC.1